MNHDKIGISRVEVTLGMPIFYHEKAHQIPIHLDEKKDDMLLYANNL